MWWQFWIWVRDRAFLSFFWTVKRLNRRIPWYRVPFPRFLGLLYVVGIRELLRRQNLHDTRTRIPDGARSTLPPPALHDRTTRTLDGACNDLADLKMGMAGTRFGRNIPFAALPQHLDDSAILASPDPRTVSQKLMTREKFRPASTLNLLAAAWIQFMVHDWFFHKNYEDVSPRDQKNDTDRPLHMIEIPLKPDDPWHAQHKDTLFRIPRTESDPTRTNDTDGPPTFINYVTHWWDASQLYGCDEETLKKLRSKHQGKLNIETKGMLPLNPKTKRDLVGFDQNWWLGLNLMHTLFTLEHNAVCDRLHADYPTWSDEELFARARLINAALIAKIHTVEWTPAILNHPTVIKGMRSNWWGMLGRRYKKNFGVSRNGNIFTATLSSVFGDTLGGILGSQKDLHGVPYSITEEFVSVYRMHPLLPDTFRFCSTTDDHEILAKPLREVIGEHVRDIRQCVPMTDLLYSFGITHPGAITLGNYPTDLQELTTQDGFTLDLAAVDILRDRERGVPRYNAFREALGLRRVKSFKELTERFEDPSEQQRWQQRLETAYENDIDRVDLMVGLFAEKPPEGFGFSDTAFRIFIVMAARRLKSDRFFTTDYRPEIYTQTGLDWVEANDISTVLLRHFPKLRPFLSQVDNAFKPWPSVTKLKGKNSSLP